MSHPVVVTEDGHRRIPLHARDGTVRAYALVDEIDYQRLGLFCWSLHAEGYAFRRERRDERPEGRRGVVYLHRAILGFDRTQKLFVDHVNRDKLDCRRENLRPLDRALNAFALIQRWESARKGSPPIDESGVGSIEEMLQRT